MILAKAILFLGPLLLVPLGLQLLKQAKLMKIPADYRYTVAISWLIAVGSLACSLLLKPSVVAAALAAPWFLVTLILAAIGGWYVVREVRDLTGQLALSASLMLIAVGAGWTLLNRAGLQPWNFSEQEPFSDPIVLLTGVHFHYAGFALPILTGWTIRHLEHPSNTLRFWTTRLGTTIRRFLVASVLGGVPLVGVGITFSPLLEVIASGLLTLATLLLAVMQIQVALQPAQAKRRGLLLISSVSLICGMTLAMTYALGEYRGTPWISIPNMIPLHGIANSLGFSLCGLIAWNLPETSPTPQESA